MMIDGCGEYRDGILDNAGWSIPAESRGKPIRAACPPSVPITAPTIPAIPPTINQPVGAPTAAPEMAAVTMRAPNCTGTVRLGVEGSRSTTVSTSTNTLRIHGVQV